MVEKIQKKLRDFIVDYIFSDIEGMVETENAQYSSLEKALRSGELTFHQGVFSGKLNATISKQLRDIGAKFSGGYFRLLKEDLPPNIMKAIDLGGVKFEKKMVKIEKILSKQLDNLNEPKLSLFDDVRDTLFSLDSSYDEKLKRIGIKEELDNEKLESISRDYVENMDRYIVDATKEEIETLRQEVQKIYLAGGREKQLSDLVQQRLGVAKGRANFIAHQEMNLMASSYQKQKMKGAGSWGYQWRTSGKNVRHDHSILNENIYTWDDPPITNQTTGARNNPGEDYNCNCSAIPLF